MELLMTYRKKNVDSHYKENNGITNVILPCLTKVGENCFNSNTDSFTSLDSLNKNDLYNCLLAANTDMNL